MQRYQDAVAGVVVRFDGYVAKFLGDGVLAYFGWPQAHEDDAERAVRAGLEIVAAVEAVRVSEHETLHTRLGIATGRVVVGDLVSVGGTDTDAVIGETPSLAARLQQVAKSGQVAVETTTRQLIGDTFKFDDLGALRLKGFDDPVQVWGVGSERAGDSRFEAAHAGHLTEFVGREHEVALLLERWQRAKDGEGQAVLLSGPAGIGKSRMLAALEQQIDTAPHYRIRYQCSPYHSNIAFYPVIRQLVHAAGIAADDDTSVKLDKLERVLAMAVHDVAPVAPLFAALLALPAEQRYGKLDLTPQQQRAATIEALDSQLFALSRQRPVLFLLEDAHWIDPSTENLIGESLSRVGNEKVLLLVTHRPEYAPPWRELPNLSSVSLNNLSRQQSIQIVRAIAGSRITDGVVGRIVERAGGVPLFVEELTRALLESGAETTAADIPASLQASLLARLDRLGEAKQIAQVGAVIGREFPHDLLAAVMDMDAGALAAGLEQLMRSDLLSRSRGTRENRYSFKHALIQDAAYESLLRDRRRELHGRVAQALTAAEVEPGERAAEVATHLQRSGQDVEAARAFTKAGDRARLLFANQEALTYFDRAVDLWRAHPQQDGDGAHRLALGNRLVALLMLTGDYRQAESVCRKILDDAGEDAPARARARMLGRLGRVLYMRGANDQARSAYQGALHLAKAAGDAARQAALYRDLGDVEFTSGTLPAAIDAYEKGGQIAKSMDDTSGLAAAQTMLCNALGRAGDIDDAIRHGEQAIELGEEIGDDRRIAWACMMLAQCCSYYFGLSEPGRARTYLARANEIFDRTGDYRGKAWWLIYDADLNFWEGKREAAAARGQEFLDRGHGSGGFQHEVTAQYKVQADYLLAMGKLFEAAQNCQTAIQRAEQSGNQLEGCEAHAIMAGVLLGMGPEHYDAAQAHAETAKTMAQQVGNKRVLGRGLLAEAQVAAARGDAHLAKERAQAARQDFETCQTPWYRTQAEALLEKLTEATD